MAAGGEGPMAPKGLFVDVDIAVVGLSVAIGCETLCKGVGTYELRTSVSAIDLVLVSSIMAQT